MADARSFRVTSVQELLCENQDLKKENATLKEKYEKLLCEKQEMEHQITELKYVLNDVQAINEVMRGDIESAVAAECGTIVIEGPKFSATYQDMVGILLSNGYGVELTLVDQGRKLRVTMKESEEE